MYNPKKVAIVGMGRFGKTLLRLLGGDFQIIQYSRNGKIPLSDVYASDCVFYCVPIDSFESVIRSHKNFFTNQTLVDVLSVKEHPAKIFAKYTKGTRVQTLLTHPMFGPDSSKNGFENLPLIINQSSASNEIYNFWKNYFKSKQLRVVELSPTEHDKLAAKSQGLTHFIGRLLDKINFRKTSIDSIGAQKLHEVSEQTCNDTWQLFLNLQNYNRFTKPMRLKLGNAYDKLYNRLLPKRVNKSKPVFGIQGGKGSFNEQALHDYVNRHGIKKYSIRYLYTSERVLSALHKGSVDYGQFAIHNSIGGMVRESILAIARYKFSIVEEFKISIRHYLMKRKDVDFKDVSIFMSHDQVFQQCKKTLLEKYPSYKQVTGTGIMIDHAKVAQALSAGKIDKNIAVIGPKILSTLYNLDIVAEDLQDLSENLTSFLLVSRIP